jgi:hypothetical protein
MANGGLRSAKERRLLGVSLLLLYNFIITVSGCLVSFLPLSDYHSTALFLLLAACITYFH